jgi:lysophospholipase L1-like esterase
MRHLLLVFACLAIPLPAQAGDTVMPLPVAVTANDANVHYSGRWDLRDPLGPRAAWPACSAWIRFSGTAANAALGGNANIGVQVAVDGRPTTVINLRDGQSLYALAEGLPAGEHTIELCKRTETFSGVLQVKGFQLAAGAKPLPVAAPKRRVEFIGDSITCGYGDEAATKEEHFTNATENAWLAWGAVASRALKAELYCEAWSGIWLMDNGKDENMPKRWERTLGGDPASTWDFARWQADAVVVNLGTNDANRPIDSKTWSDTYTAFIGRIRAVYPKAHIFLTIGAMGHGKKGEIAVFNTAIAEACRKAGDARVHALALANQDAANGIGADWHPSVKTHQLMADAIAAAIRKELGWQ